MKVQVVLPLAIVASVALMGIMKIRKKEHDMEDQRIRFSGVKLRVTNDVLGEYQSEKDYAETEMDTAQKETSALDEAVKMGQGKADKTKGELDICNGGKKTITDELAILETEFKNLQAVNEKEEASWKSEVQTLKSQLEAQSSVCNFLKEASKIASTLCRQGPKKEAAEAAKKEEAKAEVPKKEEAEAAKKEEPKAEAAKQEEPKAEAAKQEEPKAEAAKQEEPKAEAAKQEEPKAEAAKQEEPKAEAAKQKEPKAEAPKK